MQISLSPKFKMIPTLIILAALSLICSLTSVLLLGELMIPLTAASLAALFVVEGGRRRVFSIAVPILMITADLLLHGSASYVSVETVAIALIIACFFLHGSKAECSFWITLIFAFFVVLAMVLTSYAATKILTLDSFLDYYIGVYKEIETAFVSSFDDYSAAFGIPAEKATADLASKLLASVVSAIPSMVIIAGFAVSGVSLKLFSGIMRLFCDADGDEQISSWRFSLPKAMYIAFWVAMALNLILGLSGAEGILPIVISNVYSVLLLVFAYLGIGVVVSFLTTVFKHRTPAILVTLGALVMLGALAIELISYFGASFVFYGENSAENK